MKQKVAFGLLVGLILFAAPAFAAPVDTTAPTPAVSTELTVDELLTAGTVTTELVTAKRCPVETLNCSHVNQDCGVVSGQCHCKAGGVNGSQLVCVGNPTPPGPIE
jgi:hypothetical protein